MEALLTFLNSVSVMSAELRAHLTSVLKHQVISKNDYLLRPNQISNNVCFITEGLIRCYYYNNNGKDVTRWFMKEGDVIFSIRSFYNQIPSIETVQALEKTSVLYISYSELQDTYNRFPEFERHGRLLTEKYYQLWDQLLLWIVMHNATERYEWLIENHADLVQRVPGKYIASLIGITGVTLSKLRTRLAS